LASNLGLKWLKSYNFFFFLKVFGPRNARSANEIYKERHQSSELNFAVLGRFDFFFQIICFSFFFYAKLKFDVYVTGPLQETAFFLKSWL